MRRDVTPQRVSSQTASNSEHIGSKIVCDNLIKQDKNSIRYRVVRTLGAEDALLVGLVGRMLVTQLLHLTLRRRTLLHVILHTGVHCNCNHTVTVLTTVAYSYRRFGEFNELTPYAPQNPKPPHTVENIDQEQKVLERKVCYIAETQMQNYHSQ